MATQNAHRCDRRRELQWNWKLSSRWRSDVNRRLHLNKTNDKRRKLITLALQTLFRDRRMTTEKKMNLIAKKKVMMKMRERARLRQWWKRKARSRAEAGWKEGALMAKGLPEPPLSGERINFLCN